MTSGSQPEKGTLLTLIEGQRIPFGGDQWVRVSQTLAEKFKAGDKLIIVQQDGSLIHVAAEICLLVEDAVGRARQGFRELALVTEQSISNFYHEFSLLLEDEEVFGLIAAANARDLQAALTQGRPTTRLLLDEKMRQGMIEALQMWRDLPDSRNYLTDCIEYETWSIETRHAPLGIVAFVFEGRPNVFADATGVLRSGNAVVFRIGSDALQTARAILLHAVQPALRKSGLPQGCVQLVDSPARSAGHALFSHADIALAVARGSGAAVGQLGAVARQSGTPVSLHGTGGAWMLVGESADPAKLVACVDASLDRKVCNTLNVCCIPHGRTDLLQAVLAGARLAAGRRQAKVVLHCVGIEAHSQVTSLLAKSETDSGDIELVINESDGDLGIEWEWENNPEFAVRVVDGMTQAIDLFNEFSPQFIVVVQSQLESELSFVYARANAPFVGDGFTRWVDGQYALSRPELGLSNWQSGRLFGRGGILSGDGVFCVRHLATHHDSHQRR